MSTLPLAITLLVLPALCFAGGGGNSLNQPTTAPSAPSAFAAPPSTQPVSGSDNGIIYSGVPAATPADKANTSAAGAGGVSDYRQALKDLFPLSPAEIQSFRATVDATRHAIHPGPAPAMQTRTLLLDLQPGAPVPVIHVAPGYVSSIVFLDSTGAPWPITSVTVGDAKWFSVQAPKVDPQNLLTVSALGSHLASNMAVTLTHHTTPIVIALETSASDAAVLTALRANEQGPNAKTPTLEPEIPVGADGALLAFLDEVPPAGAIVLKSTNRDVEAWQYQRGIYVRTHFAVISPAFISVVRGEAGVRVYHVPLTPSVVFSHGGTPLTVDLSPPAWAALPGSGHTGGAP